MSLYYDARLLLRTIVHVPLPIVKLISHNWVQLYRIFKIASLISLKHIRPSFLTAAVNLSVS